MAEIQTKSPRAVNFIVIPQCRERSRTEVVSEAAGGNNGVAELFGW
jgi:hypothetical protein